MEDEHQLTTRDFEFEYKSSGKLYRLSVPVEIPYEHDKRELVQRLMKIHSIPPYEESRLCEDLSHFIADAPLQEWDRQADERLSNCAKVYLVFVPG